MTAVSVPKRFFVAIFFILVLLLLMQPAQSESLTPQRQAELINMVKHDCGSCHGLTLQGGLGPPLTSTALTEKPQELLYNAIKLGRDHTAMPPWDGLLTRDEIDWLVQLLKNGVAENQSDDSE